MRTAPLHPWLNDMDRVNWASTHTALFLAADTPWPADSQPLAFWVMLSCIPQTVSQSGSALPYVAFAWYWLARREVTYGCHCHHGNWTFPFWVLSPISIRIWKWAQNLKDNFLRDCEKNQQGPQIVQRRDGKKVKKERAWVRVGLLHRRKETAWSTKESTSYRLWPTSDRMEEEEIWAGSILLRDGSSARFWQGSCSGSIGVVPHFSAWSQVDHLSMSPKKLIHRPNWINSREKNQSCILF